MIVKLRKNVKVEQIEKLIGFIESLGFEVDCSFGENTTLLGLIGDTSGLDSSIIKSFEAVDEIIRIQESYKRANRKFHPEDTVVTLENGTKIGGGNFCLIAGPCSVESEEQIIEVAKRVKDSGANILRGGAFKPRTSPYSFQGKGEAALKLLLKAKEITGLPIISEIMEIGQLPLFEDVDILQVGARNMQNFDLLKALGKQSKPVLLKRGLSATYEELLMAAEYIMSEGNDNVILCERGIRTFETGVRNTLDITAIPVLHEKTHLPVIVDPSHSSGVSRLVKPLSLASVGASCDGLIIEVHNDPENALCDGNQSLRPDEFDDMARSIFRLKEAMMVV
ncbi:3-deoxy-7-phosphoheptulonate synthase [Peptostreptococcus porci]|uniref:3-deoxy-7-phosphoheptulonate synthase n=1 Tax=Peptostreptococcus porci TaxID=2652282 RepID=UPI002A92036B|nr:3-deoxy-7-phosphoheptulonate synthase [Peptostreptococcus porci]MDY6232849.1 3-deoxy-7-phosphoheptulonate synthase [Peptostreptococcus porci]